MALGAIAWLKKLALPPAGPLMLALVSLPLPDPWRTVGTATGLGLLWLFSMPLVGLWLLRGLETGPRLDVEHLATDPGVDPRRDALVVLDGGRYHRPSEQKAAKHEVSKHGAVRPETLERLHHAARVARATGLPILATGDGAGALMGEVLEQDFGMPARWLETLSRNTQENADRSAEILLPLGRRRVVLVTHGWHMERSLRAFRRAGFEVVPAPCSQAGPDRLELKWLALVPSAGGLLSSWRALHEYIGLAWYALRYRRSS